MNQTSNSRSPDIPVPFFLDKAGSPRSWLLLLDNRFKSLNVVVPVNKFNYVMSCMTTELLTNLSEELVDASKSADPYKDFKESLVDHYKPSPQQLFEEYFRNQTSDRKPSEVLSKAISDMEKYYPFITDDHKESLRNSFLSFLPTNINSILKDLSHLDLKELASYADKIWLNHEPKPILVNGTTEITLNSLHEEILLMREEITSLKSQIFEVQKEKPKKVVRINGNHSEFEDETIKVSDAPKSNNKTNKYVSKSFNGSSETKLTNRNENIQNGNSELKAGNMKSIKTSEKDDGCFPKENKLNKSFNNYSRENSYKHSHSRDCLNKSVNKDRSSPTEIDKSNGKGEKIATESERTTSDNYESNSKCDYKSTHLKFQKKCNEDSESISNVRLSCYYHNMYGKGARRCQLGCVYSPKPEGLELCKNCVYHGRYGTKAQNCVKGCKFKANLND